MPQFGSGAYRFAKDIKGTTIDWVFGKWNDILLSGNQSALMDALVQPDVTAKLAAIKRLTPGSRRMVEALGVFTALVGDKIDAGEYVINKALE